MADRYGLANLQRTTKGRNLEGDLSEEFDLALAKNLERKKKKDSGFISFADMTALPPPEEEVIKPVIDDPVAPVQEETSLTPEAAGDKENLFWKTINFLNEPLSGGYFGRKTRELSAAEPDTKEIIKHTGGKNPIQDKLAEFAAAIEGFKRGAFEGAGDAADSITSPSTLLSLAGGGIGGQLASRGLKGAKQVNAITRLIEGSQIPHGGAAALDPTKSTWERVMGAGEAVGGYVGAFHGGNPAPKVPAPPGAKPGLNVKVQSDPLAGAMDLDLNTAKTPPPPPSGPTEMGPGLSNRVPQGNVPKAPEGSPLAKPIESSVPPQVDENQLANASIEDLERLANDPDPTVQEAVEAEFAKREAAMQPPIQPAGVVEPPPGVAGSAGNPARFTPPKQGLVEPPPVSQGSAAPGMGDIDLAKELEWIEQQKAGQPQSDPALENPNIPESPEQKAARLTAGKSTQNKVPGRRSQGRMNFDGLKNFVSDESGEIDLSRLFQGEEDMGYGVRTNDPDAIDIGEVNNPAGDVDLQRASNEMASDMAKPVGPIRRFLQDEDGSFDPEFMNRAGSQEHSPDLLQTDIEPIGPGGTSPEFYPREEMVGVPRGPNLPPEPPQQSAWMSLDDFLSDERGAVGDLPKKRGGSRSVPRPVISGEETWKQLPDAVKKLFTEADITPKDLNNTSLKDAQDTYDALVRQREGLEPVAPQKDPTKAPPRLVKASGEKVEPLTDLQREDKLIEELTKKAMKAAELERKELLRSGEQESTPDEVSAAMDQFRQSIEPPVDRTGQIPLLRSKDYANIPPESAKSARRRDAGLWGGRQSFQDQPLDIRPKGFDKKPAIAPEPSGGYMDAVKKFYEDESGEIDLGGIFGDEPPPPVSKYPDKLLTDVTGSKGAEIIPRNTLPEKPEATWKQWLNAPLGAASVDLPFVSSAAFRQASPLAWTKGWMEAWGKAAQVYGSQEAYNGFQKAMKEHPLFKPRYKPKYGADGVIQSYKEMPSIAEEAGIRLSDLGNYTKREEYLRGNLAEKLPGVWGSAIRGSNRAYSAFLDHTRMRTFETLMGQQKWSGLGQDQTVIKNIAEFVNDATGAGSLKFQGPGGMQADLENSAGVLRNALWSPRLLASRAKFLNPYTYVNAAPEVRQQYINGALRSAGTWLTFAGLAKMGGADVSLDPTNSDFGKIKIGDTRIDPGAGFQQLLVLAARLAPGAVGDAMGTKTGKFTSSSTGKTQEYGAGAFPKDRMNVLEDFGRSKLHPVYGLAWDLMRASDKRPVHLADRAVQLALPIMAQDILEAGKADPELAAMLGPLSSIGVGTSTYGKGDRLSDPVFTDSIESAIGAKPRSLAGTVRGW